jgi:pimeloyl-ACP methyl ester carboxylesterase
MQCRLAAWTFAAAMGLTAWSAMAADAQTPAATCRSRGIGADSECAVNGVTLHYVDWGGRRGFGHSAIPPSGYDPETLAIELRDFLKVVGVRHADLVGHSMSGLELTRVAGSDPDLVRRLVYLDAATDKSAPASMWDKDPLAIVILPRAR